MIARDVFYYAVAFVAAVYGLYLILYMSRDRGHRAEVRQQLKQSAERAEAALELERRMLDIQCEILARLPARDP